MAPPPTAGLVLRSALFVGLFYALMAGMGLVGAPVVLWRDDWCRAWMKRHNRIAFWLLRRLCRIRVEIRGPVPTGAVIVAAKHQSLLDVLMLYNALPEPRFVMKRALLWMPVFGLYARRTGAIPIDRSAGAEAVRRLVAAFSGRAGQIVIYPQGTRVAPGAPAPYRSGVSRLYAALDRPIVLAATNAGLVWPRRGMLRHPGTAVVEFLATLPTGLGKPELMSRIEPEVEAATARLEAEARAPAERPPG